MEVIIHKNRLRMIYLDGLHHSLTCPNELVEQQNVFAHPHKTGSAIGVDAAMATVVHWSDASMKLTYW